MNETRDRTQVNIRLDRRLLDELDGLAGLEQVDRSDMARRLLGVGIASYRGDMAMREYRKGTVSAWRAAELAGVSLYEMLDRIRQEGIPFELDAEVLERVGASLGAASAVREGPAIYRPGAPDAESGISDLREQFRPERVRTLFVGESSPAGGTHFYRANSNLFRATREAFARAFEDEQVPDGPRFLHWFREWGGWLVDLSDRPVNKLPAAERARVVAEGIGRLSQVIAQTSPDRIVSVKATIGGPVHEAAHRAGFTGEIVELPFPVRQWREVHVQQLARALRGSTAASRVRESVAPAMSSDAQLHEAPAGTAVRTQRVTEVDITKGRIRIPVPGAAKTVLPRAKSTIRVSLRDRRMDATYDPRSGPDRERSGVIRVDRTILRELVRPNEVLRLAIDEAGVVHLD